MVAATPYNVPRDPLMGGNHLTAVRWVLAGLVALGHAFLLTEAREPVRIHQWTGGYMAVNGFFVLSGMLIAKSLDLGGSLRRYAAARALRIYPALIVVMLSFPLFFAPFFGEPGGWSALTSSESWAYVARVLLMGSPENAPGGIFTGSLEEDFNGPLWTIRYEVAAYVLAALGFAVGVLKRPLPTLFAYLVVQTVYLVLPLMWDPSTVSPSILPLLRLSSAFLLGMCLWQFPEARRPHWALVLGVIVAFAVWGAGPLGEWLATLAVTGLMLRIGLSDTLHARVQTLPDYSYGIYIWHYPAMQMVLSVQPDIDPAGLALLSTPLFIILAAASWHAVEKPVLRLKPRGAGRVNRIDGESARLETPSPTVDRSNPHRRRRPTYPTSRR